MDFIKDEGIESATKYLYFFILNEARKARSRKLDLPIQNLVDSCGLSAHRIYRARGQLIKLGALKVTKKFCPDTGKTVKNIYEVFNEK